MRVLVVVRNTLSDSSQKTSNFHRKVPARFFITRGLDKIMTSSVPYAVVDVIAFFSAVL